VSDDSNNAIVGHQVPRGAHRRFAKAAVIFDGDLNWPPVYAACPIHVVHGELNSAKIVTCRVRERDNANPDG
jgi:hypothetical protein